MSTGFQIIDANTMIGLHPAHRLDMTVERLVGEMDKHGIAASLTLSAIGIFHSSQQGNRITLEAAAGNNRLVPVATVNPKAFFGTAEDLRTVKAQGCRIVKFFPLEQGWSPRSVAFRALLRELSPLKMPVMVDAGAPGDPGRLVKAVEDYSASVILCSVPMEELAEALAVMQDIPTAMLETHELHTPGALETIAQRVGADRVIFGSGAPRRSIAASLHYVLNSELSDDEKQRILGGNIKRVLEAA